MRKSLTKALAVISAATLLIGLTSCTSSKTDTVDHKPATAGCLIKSDKPQAGTPEKQLAADLVEAQVVSGIKVREVVIPTSSKVMAKLLTALQTGCVFMLSSEERYLDSLVSFAKLHPKMMVMFVGGEVPASNQPANFRWLADDMVSGAKLAGYASAELGEKVYLFVADNYYQAAEIRKAFKLGVKEFNRVNSKSVGVEEIRVNSVNAFQKKLQLIVEPSVLGLFAGKNYLSGISDYTNLTVVASDIQYGQTRAKLNSKVVASVERNTSLEVIRAISSLLLRKINSDPAYRKPFALKSGLIAVKSIDPASQGLNDYRQKLISEFK